LPLYTVAVGINQVPKSGTSAGDAWAAWFALSAWTIPTITVLGKAFDATDSAQALDVADPIIGVAFRHLLLAVGLLELFIAFFCLFTDKRQFRLLAVVWAGTSYVGQSFCVRFKCLGCCNLL